MDAQRKLRNLLSYAKTDSVEELEDCNKLYEELLAHLNKQEKITELLVLYDKFMYHVLGGAMIVAYRVQEKILKLKAEIEEMK